MRDGWMDTVLRIILNVDPVVVPLACTHKLRLKIKQKYPKPP